MSKRLTKNIHWFSVGIGIKRWLLMMGVGSGILGLGVVYLIILGYRYGWLSERIYNWITLQGFPVLGRVVFLFGLGGGIIIWASIRMGRNLLAPFRADGDEQGVAESLYRHHFMKKGPHIVVIGGGNGLATLLRGLRKHTSNITAVITVADDGGSSGRLRNQLGMLPPGDIRNNMAALARDEILMTQLLQYRFGRLGTDGEESGLEGHAFGNLLLAALTGITGSFDEALLAAERVLLLQGRVLPSTLDQVNLVADIEVGGEIVRIVGESAIPKARGQIKQIYLEPENVRIYPPALEAIFAADLIVLGPGSLFTSILPNLLLPELKEALYHAKAKKLYICNVATQAGETDNYTVADHVRMLEAHIGVGCIDCVLANDYLSEEHFNKVNYVAPFPPENIEMVCQDLIDIKQPWRHDSDKLGAAVILFLNQSIGLITLPKRRLVIDSIIHKISSFIGD